MDVRTHASIENACGPGCQYDDVPGTTEVSEVPAKRVAVSPSVNSAPGTLRLKAAPNVRSFEPARSYPVVLLVSPMRQSQSGESASTAVR